MNPNPLFVAALLATTALPNAAAFTKPALLPDDPTDYTGSSDPGSPRFIPGVDLCLPNKLGFDPPSSCGEGGGPEAPCDVECGGSVVDCLTTLATFDATAPAAFDELARRSQADPAAIEAAHRSLRQAVAAGCAPVPLEDVRCFAAPAEHGFVSLYCGLWCGMFPKAAGYEVAMSAHDEGTHATPLIYAGVSCSSGYNPVPPTGVSCAGHMRSCWEYYGEGVQWLHGACVFIAFSSNPVIDSHSCSR